MLQHIVNSTKSENNNSALSSTTEKIDDTINLNSLYCSHLWTNSKLRKAIINGSDEYNVIRHCYSCNGKIRKYDIRSIMNDFTPKTYSTPNGKIIGTTPERNNSKSCIENEHFETICSYKINSDEDINNTNDGVNQCIPSISQQIDLDIRHKFTAYDNRCNERKQRRLKKSLKRMGCVINFGLSDSPVKKRTQIRACSISVMVVAIVVISFILVNFTTPAFTRVTNVTSTTIVPTNILNENETSITHVDSFTDISILTDLNTTEYSTSLDSFRYFTTENISLLSSVVSKIRKNIKTYPKEASKNKGRSKTKDINNRDLSQRFCSCKNNEICMLEESSGKSVCRQPIDDDDPTGCGGLCALETEACQVVDKELGVRVCRLLMLSTCSPQEWRCRNGLCIPAASRCDGSIQCYDRSDEVQCQCDLSRQFRCGQSISCFSKIKLCDGIMDCWDGFDELNCTTECPKDMSACSDGQCILSSRFCDGLIDCDDGSDEPNGCDGDCGAREIKCKNGRCVLRTTLCDGRDNCGDASDEMNCS